MNDISRIVKDIRKFDIAKKALSDNDNKIIRAIGQNKWIMASYYYGRNVELFQLFPKLNIKKSCPGMQYMRDASNTMRKSSLYNASKKDKDIDYTQVNMEEFF